jgi:adenine-specific DNA-methyltransferase
MVKMKQNDYNIPTAGPEREALRQKGQFWTPSWVAEAMIAYVVENTDLIFDPAVGKGAFYTALESINFQLGKKIEFYGTDIDQEVIEEAKREKIFDKKSCRIENRDFIVNPPSRKFKSIIANPPYIRHHRLSPEIKIYLKQLSLQTLGIMIDGRAGLHVYFLIRALTLLDDNGKLAFIMPADTCEGIFAKKLWTWIKTNFCLEGVVTFSPGASPFPKVDTNAVIFLIKKTRSCKKIHWVKCLEANTYELKELIESNFKKKTFAKIKVIERDIDESLNTGLSREPQKNGDIEFRLKDFAKVMRGIATGDNDYFFLTREKVKLLGIPKEYLLMAIGRTKDVDNSIITKEILTDLDQKGRPTLLFSPDGRGIDNFPESVRSYLKEGEILGVSKRTLISTRNPWYKMEKRLTPAFLFAYLGRRHARFIKNNAGVVPLTCFLCVYPRINSEEYIEKLWSILQNNRVIANLNLVGKSYGGGAIKVEPRSLEMLPLPTDVVTRSGLDLLLKKNQLPLVMSA